MKGLHMVAWILLIVGGLNWGLAVFGWDVQKLIIGGNGSVFFTVLYLLIGVSALVELFTHGKNCKCCEGMCTPKTPNQSM